MKGKARVMIPTICLLLGNVLCASALTADGQADRVTELIAQLKDSNPTTRWNATNSLGQTKDMRAVEPLITALKDANAVVQQGAVSALGAIGPRAVDPLILALKDTDPNVRQGAASALGEINDTRALGPLADAMKDANPSVRQHASVAFLAIGSPESRQTPSPSETWTTPNSRFAAIDRIVILPVIDARADKGAKVDIQKLRKSAENILHGRHYETSQSDIAGNVGSLDVTNLSETQPEWIRRLGPPEARYVMVITLRDTSGNNRWLFSAKFVGSLFDKESGSVVWSGEGLGQPPQPTPGTAGLSGAASQAASQSVANLVAILTGLERNEVVDDALGNLLNGIPKLPKRK